LKLNEISILPLGADSRAPRGARGLKLYGHSTGNIESMSRPARGAWIETDDNKRGTAPDEVAPRAGRVD